MIKRGKIVILNGPPGSGKDYLAKLFAQSYGANGKHRQVKDPLFEQVLSLSKIPKPIWFKRYNDRKLKEEAWDRLGGLSCREFMIKVSEEYVKPIFGKDFYGRQASLNAVNDVESNIYTAFSDGGFQEEFDAMKDAVGRDNILLVRLHREGSEWGNDSRSYLTNPDWEMDLSNNSTGLAAVSQIICELNRRRYD